MIIKYDKIVFNYKMNKKNEIYYKIFKYLFY